MSLRRSRWCFLFKRIFLFVLTFSLHKSQNMAITNEILLNITNASQVARNILIKHLYNETQNIWHFQSFIYGMNYIYISVKLEVDFNEQHFLVRSSKQTYLAPSVVKAHSQQYNCKFSLSVSA